MVIVARADAAVERSRHSIDLVKVSAWIGGTVLSWAAAVIVAKFVIAALS
jgi:hypothetical protein